jgi:hypothetical protein
MIFRLTFNKDVSINFMFIYGHIIEVALKCLPFAQCQGSLPVHGLPRPYTGRTPFEAECLKAPA